jgi:heat shock protein HtpX
MLPDDQQLLLRMGLALATATGVTLATLAGVVLIVRTPDGGLIVLAAVVIVAIGSAITPGWKRGRFWEPLPADVDRVEQALHRLALMADVPAPLAVVERDGLAPLSWTVAVPGKPPAIHVTTALLERLDDPQLEAVLAHELAHVIHRDARVMTVIAGWPAAYLRAIRAGFDSDGIRGQLSYMLVLGLWLLPSAILLLWTARIVSRQREIVADRTAAMLTGSPAAVAGALITLSGRLNALRDMDLRTAGTNDLFSFLPTRKHEGILAPWATHPPLDGRLKRLQRLERELQR